MSTLPLQAVGSGNLYFAQVANGRVGNVDYFTGLAVLNPDSNPVDITIGVHDSAGRSLGTATRTLAGREKYVRLLWEIEGIGRLPNQASGYIRISARQPVFSFVMFGDIQLNFLSAVPAQDP